VDVKLEYGHRLRGGTKGDSMSEMTTNEEPTRTPAAKRAIVEAPPPQPQPAPQRPPVSAATILLTVLILVVVGSILGSCYLVYSMVTSVADLPGRVLGGVREALEAGDPTYSTLPAVIEQLRPLSRLETEEYFLTTIVEATKPRLIGGIGEEKLVLVACGRVTAGVDLSQIEEQDISSEGTKVTIKLPPAEIFDTFADEESGCTYVYDHSHPVLTEPSTELASEARQKALEGFRETALQNGILEKAYVRAQQEIARLLLLAGYETVEFTDVGDQILLPQE
jgi:hypothetical protein